MISPQIKRHGILYVAGGLIVFATIFLLGSKVFAPDDAASAQGDPDATAIADFGALIAGLIGLAIYIAAVGLIEVSRRRRQH